VSKEGRKYAIYIVPEPTIKSGCFAAPEHIQRQKIRIEKQKIRTN